MKSSSHQHQHHLLRMLSFEWCCVTAEQQWACDALTRLQLGFLCSVSCLEGKRDCCSGFSTLGFRSASYHSHGIVFLRSGRWRIRLGADCIHDAYTLATMTHESLKCFFSTQELETSTPNFSFFTLRHTHT